MTVHVKTDHKSVKIIFELAVDFVNTSPRTPL